MKKLFQGANRSNKVEQAQKLRIVTRTDLSQGQKIVQVAHVATEFAKTVLKISDGTVDYKGGGKLEYFGSTP